VEQPARSSRLFDHGCLLKAFKDRFSGDDPQAGIPSADAPETSPYPRWNFPQSGT